MNWRGRLLKLCPEICTATGDQYDQHISPQYTFCDSASDFWRHSSVEVLLLREYNMAFCGVAS